MAYDPWPTAYDPCNVAMAHREEEVYGFWRSNQQLRTTNNQASRAQLRAFLNTIFTQFLIAEYIYHCLHTQICRLHALRPGASTEFSMRSKFRKRAAPQVPASDWPPPSGLRWSSDCTKKAGACGWTVLTLLAWSGAWLPVERLEVAVSTIKLSRQNCSTKTTFDKTFFTEKNVSRQKGFHDKQLAHDENFTTKNYPLKNICYDKKIRTKKYDIFFVFLRQKKLTTTFIHDKKLRPKIFHETIFTTVRMLINVSMYFCLACWIRQGAIQTQPVESDRLHNSTHKQILVVRLSFNFACES